MGGQGSGRLPSVETIIKRSQPEQTPIGTSLFLPNYSGVQEAALKTSAPLETGSSSPSVWQSGSGVIYYNDGNVGIGVSAPSAKLEVAGSISGSSTLSISGSLLVDTTGRVALGSNDFSLGYFFINSSSGAAKWDIPLAFNRNTTDTNSASSSFRSVGKSTGNMVDGFGVRYRFEIQDNAAGPNIISTIEGTRDGDDTSGKLAFFTDAGNVEALMLRASGNVELGRDNHSLIWGAGQDASIKYDGTNLVVNPKLVGSGIVDVLGTLSGSQLNGNNLKIYKGTRWLKPYHWAPAVTSQTFTAGRVILTEFEVLNDCVVDAINYTTGSTLSGSVLLGIYGPISTEETCSGSALLVQQSLTPSGTSTAQLVSISGSSLLKGRYYLAISGDDILGTYMRTSNTTQVLGWGQFYDKTFDGTLDDPCPATTNTGNGLLGIVARCSE